MHQNSLILIKRQMKNMQYKKMHDFRFIGLLCIAFLFQDFSFATQQKSSECTNLSYKVIQNNFIEKGNTEHQYPQLYLFVEAESEDEDEIHNEQNVYNEFISTNQNFNVINYTDAINRLFLRLASTYQHKVDLPFFILYHSWKSHLA